jgi:hypothetical protein
MDADTKEYFECMIDENSSFTKRDYRDGLGQLLYSAERNHKRAEAWKAACKAQEEIASYCPEYDTGPGPDYEEIERILKIAEDLERD